MGTHDNIMAFYSEVIKEEPLSTLEPDMTADNTCVLESTSPFFGYYQDAPMGQPDPYIYCVLKDHCPLVDIVRATLKINAKRRNPVDITVGSVTLQDKTCAVIRIKDINQFSQVQIIQQSLMEEGIVFKKRQRNIYEQMAMIRLSKMLYLIPKGDGLFLDTEDDTKGYFSVPRHYSWDEFKDLTAEAKYDTRILYFDAAQATILENRAITDMVRIYKLGITMGKLRDIRDRYLQLIR